MNTKQPNAEAFQKGDLEIVNSYLIAGGDVHACNDLALRVASEYGHTETVKTLLEAGRTFTPTTTNRCSWR